MKKFWAVFLGLIWPVIAVGSCLVSPAYNYWFPVNPANGTTSAASPLGQQIDDLFYMILWIVTIVFIGVSIALFIALWRSATDKDGEEGKAVFSHGSHNLEVIWTIVPAGILLFIALYQMDVWAQYRVIDNFPEEARRKPVAEVTARQFEWRIRYPAPGKTLEIEPERHDLHAVNELHVPTGRPVMINLRTQDVQHSFFAPELRVKQDAVPGLVIPVWFEVTESGKYTLLCAELCGWGHYKMKANIIAEPESEYNAYLERLKAEQNEDGFPRETDDEDE